MENMDLALLLKYPLLSWSNQEKNKLSGYVSVGEKDYSVIVKQADTKFLLKILDEKDIQNKINTALNNTSFSNIVSYLDKLVELLSANDRKKSYLHATNNYRLVLNEYNEICNFCTNVNRCSISEDLEKINITITDNVDRKHEFIITVHLKNTSDIFLIEHHDLPDTQGISELVKNYNSLRKLCEKFISAVESLQEFFDLMDEVDSKFWILDPEKPKRKDVYRRIVLCDNVSIIVTFDPYKVRSVPNIKFLGPERLIEKYRVSLMENLADFDVDGNIIDELLKLLGVETLPSKPTNIEEENILVNTGECCICFCLRLEAKLPEIICPNKSCEVSFHTMCLYQWFVSLNCRRSFNEIIGNCPNCEKKVSCPVL